MGRQMVFSMRKKMVKEDSLGAEVDDFKFKYNYLLENPKKIHYNYHSLLFWQIR